MSNTRRSAVASMAPHPFACMHLSIGHLWSLTGLLLPEIAHFKQLQHKINTTIVMPTCVSCFSLTERFFFSPYFLFASFACRSKSDTPLWSHIFSVNGLGIDIYCVVHHLSLILLCFKISGFGESRKVGVAQVLVSCFHALTCHRDYTPEFYLAALHMLQIHTLL
jgi:hypothetical protein